MPHSTQVENERISTLTPGTQAGVRVVRRHHLLVRWSHWLNVPILLGLILSGISIYWASPIYKHVPNPQTGSFDPLADIGIWICTHVPGLHQYNSPPDWVYNHISLGPGMLAAALRIHWLCAYLFMLNGLAFVSGSAMGGGWRSLLPRRTDLRDAFKMFRYYLEVPLAKLTHRTWLHPRFNTKYNPLQRVAYLHRPSRKRWNYLYIAPQFVCGLFRGLGLRHLEIVFAGVKRYQKSELFHHVASVPIPRHP